MKRKYDEILNDMKSTYENESGTELDMMSDTGLRLKTVASELYALSTYGDFIFRQGFVQTATGEYLDRHAYLRSITRKAASKANGILTFGLAVISDNDVTVKAGTICSDKDNSLVQFVTTQHVTIPSGSLTANAPAVAIECGRLYNVKSNRITNIVNPPALVYSVTNENAFSGGCNNESDESLRKRIISTYSYPKNGVDGDFLSELICNIDDVLDCRVTPTDNGVLKIYAKTRNNQVDNNLLTQIKDVMGICILCGGDVNVVPAQPKSFTLSALINIDKAYDAGDVVNQVKNVIENMCQAEKIGKNISLSVLESASLTADGVSLPELFSPNEMAGEVYCNADEYLVLESVTVYEK